MEEKVLKLKKKGEGAGEEVKPASELDVSDWLMVSGSVSERELVRKFPDKAGLGAALAALASRGLVSREKKFFATVYSFNYRAPEAAKLRARLTQQPGRKDDGKKFKTNLDVLASLVERFDAVGVGKAARFFNTDEETLKSWARILESHGLATIYYPIIGDTVVAKKESKLKAVNASLRTLAMILLAALAVTAVALLI